MLSAEAKISPETLEQHGWVPFATKTEGDKLTFREFYRPQTQPLVLLRLYYEPPRIVIYRNNQDIFTHHHILFDGRIELIRTLKFVEELLGL